MRKILQQKIEELRQLAEEAHEPSVQIIMLVLQGAMASGDEMLLAEKVKEFTKDVLIPRAKDAKAQNIIRRN